MEGIVERRFCSGLISRYVRGVISAEHKSAIKSVRIRCVCANFMCGYYVLLTRMCLAIWTSRMMVCKWWLDRYCRTACNYCKQYNFLFAGSIAVLSEGKKRWQTLFVFIQRFSTRIIVYKLLLLLLKQDDINWPKRGETQREGGR